MVVENVLETLGDDPTTRQEAAHQLIYDVLVEPAERQNLPRGLSERVAMDHHQMRLYAPERPEA